LVAVVRSFSLKKSIPQVRILYAMELDFNASVQRQAAGFCFGQPSEVLNTLDTLLTQLPTRDVACVNRGNLLSGNSSAAVHTAVNKSSIAPRSRIMMNLGMIVLKVEAFGSIRPDCSPLRHI